MASPRALQVLEILGDNAFRIDTESFKRVLEKVGARRFALYSINGATRTGKSFALNYFLRYLVSLRDGEGPAENRDGGAGAALSEHFVWKSGKQRTTVGIDLWSEPFFVRDTAGREVAILLMDTQGLFDERTTARANAVIFSFSALCSSVSIFNLMKNMDEKVLQELQFFTGYAHMVSTTDQTHHNQSNAAYAGQPAPVDTDEDLDEDGPFQRMVFLIRDFGFPDYDFGYHDAMGSPPNSELANYFTDTFHPTEDCPRENLFVREKILQAYKNVAFYLMPHPGPKFERNSTLPTDPDFEQHMQAFVELITSPEYLVTKKVGAHEVTGSQFQLYIEKWADLAVQADEYFPKVQVLSEASAIIQNSLAFNMAYHIYEKSFQEFMAENFTGIPTAELEQQHQKLKEEALKNFDQTKKLGSKHLEEEHRHRLEESVLKLFERNSILNKIMLEKELARQKSIRMAAEIEELKKGLTTMVAAEEHARRILQMQLAGYVSDVQRQNQNFEKEHKELLHLAAELKANVRRQVRENVVLRNNNGVNRYDGPKEDGEDLELTRKLIKGKFKNVVETKRHVMAAIKSYPNLRTGLDIRRNSFLSDRMLLKLRGTIPVNLHEIPVVIWLVDNYPTIKPTVFVHPPPTMNILAFHGHVDRDGKVCHPYLEKWHQDSHTLTGLIQQLILIFETPSPFVVQSNDRAAYGPRLADNDPRGRSRTPSSDNMKSRDKKPPVSLPKKSPPRLLSQLEAASSGLGSLLGITKNEVAPPECSSQDDQSLPVTPDAPPDPRFPAVDSSSSRMSEMSSPTTNSPITSPSIKGELSRSTSVSCWVPGLNGSYPSDPVIAGCDKDGSNILVIRGTHLDAKIPGKLHVGQRWACLPYDGKELVVRIYEVLVDPTGSTFKWVPHSSSLVLDRDAVEGGYTIDDTTLFIGRLKHEGMQIPGKIDPRSGRCVVPYNGVEVESSIFDVLVGPNPIQMVVQTAQNPLEMAITKTRIRNEIRKMEREGQDPQCQVSLVDDDDLFHWAGMIIGPANSPYEGGIFSLSIHLPSNYPTNPPRITFTTKVYHPNIDKEGTIGLDILGRAWIPALNLVTVLLSIRSLLCDPNLGHPLVPKIAHLYQSDRTKFNQTAREWTRNHAF